MVSNILELSNELLYEICDFLTDAEIGVLRLTCSLFAAVGARQAFEEIVLYLHHGDFEMLQQIAEHPKYHKHVKSLVYKTDILKPRFLSYKKYARGTRRQDKEWYRAKLLMSKNPLCKVPTPTPPPEISEEAMREVYSQYEVVHKNQTRIIGEKLDFILLQHIIPKFINLQSILVSAGGEFREGISDRQPFRPFFSCSRTEMEPAACRHSAAILLPLVGATCINLRSLRLGSIRFDFINELEAKFDHMIDIFRHLTTLELRIETGFHEDEELIREDETHVDRGPSNVIECKTTVANGTIRRFIACLPKLEALEISFTYIDEVSDAYPARFSDVVSPEMHLENLRELRLGAIEGTRQEILDFIRLHSGSLSDIVLRDIRLIRSSWLVFLPKLKEIADDTFLDNVLISRDILGESEDPEHRGRIERWDLGDPEIFGDEDCLSKEITDYILSDSGECPLELSE